MVVDTREKENHHITRFFKNNEIPYISKKLDFGDYSFFTSENQVVDKIGNFTKKIAIERKNSLSEICLNFTKKRKQFEDEFKRSKKVNSKIILMIEDKEENIVKHNYRSEMHPNALKGSLEKWSDRYNFNIEFLKKENAGWYIYNTCKQYLNNYLVEL